MTRIKLCGLSRPCDIKTANLLKPEYIGFVFAPKSRRYIDNKKAVSLKRLLAPTIQTVGVFVNEAPQIVAAYLNKGIIDIAQLHGGESTAYIKQLQTLTDKPLIQAFRIESERDIEDADASLADEILLDSGPGGTGTTFNWKLLERINRPYFLAGGLTVQNVSDAVRTLRPYAVDVSSGIETDGFKDRDKMNAFVSAVRASDMKYAKKDAQQNINPERRYSND